VRKVRQKLERVSPDWNYIHTHFGVGYRFDPERRDGTQTPEQPAASVESPVPDDAAPAAARIAEGPAPLDDEAATLLAP
jgi:zona occludens toxin (predicted ATPase)